ncbi:MAG TPA: hypothetical protein VIH99_14210 [Bdellovibrionota bacterium]|jgi:hypothetical protein
MKITPILVLATVILAPSAQAAMRCQTQYDNLCYTISGVKMQRINASPSFQKALKAVASKLNPTTVYIYQGYRTAAEQRALVRQNCGAGRTHCPGFASPNGSRHVISTAADPMVPGSVTKKLCYAENQARTEFLGPRSAAAVYTPAGMKTPYTYGHVDDSTGSNYTPRNCGRNEGIGAGTVAQKDDGQKNSAAVEDYKKQKELEGKPIVADAAKPAAQPVAPKPVVAAKPPVQPVAAVRKPSSVAAAKPRYVPKARPKINYGVSSRTGSGLFEDYLKKSLGGAW